MKVEYRSDCDGNRKKRLYNNAFIDKKLESGIDFEKCLTQCKLFK